MRHIRLYVAIVSVVVSWGSGCQIPPHPVWLPDSSGFIYTQPTEQPFGFNMNVDVLHFDLTARKARKVLSRSQTSTRVPAISPDGKQFALIRATAAATSDTVEVLVYDFLGRQVRKSSPVIWKADNQEFFNDNGPVTSVTCESAGIWSPGGNHLLFWFVSFGGESGGWMMPSDPREPRIGEYNFQTGKFREIQVMPLVHLFYVGVSPISDDDKGFLGCQMGDEFKMQPPLLFVEWDGTKHELKGTREARARLTQILASTLEHKAGEKLSTDSLRRWLWAPFPRGRWDSGTLSLAIAGGRLRIDTRKRTIIYEPDEQLAEQRSRLLRDRIIDAAPLGNGERIIYSRIPEDRSYFFVVGHRYELVEGPEGKRRPLGRGSWFMSVAPNKKSVVVTCRAKGENHKNLMTVINDEKGILATVEVPPTFPR